MNRERMRGRTIQSRATTLGLDERLERVLVYAVSLLFSLFLLPLGWLPGLILYFVEKNRNVRMHSVQASLVFGVLSILYFLVNLIKGLLGWIPLLHILTNLGLGLLASAIWWVMIILAIYLIIMVWFRPNYRLPFVSRFLDRWV
ncbi:MAG TPA: DUF4870 domain-containing protein [Ktedonobacteraceae bacterium]